MNDAALLAAARRAAESSYSPYSRFRVGAAVLGADGSVHVGANVENAAYGSSICAEANAVTTAVAAGVRRITAVAVACLDGPGCSPCGNCRQIMREFETERVVLEGADGEPVAFTLEELLRRSFGPEDLREP